MTKAEIAVLVMILGLMMVLGGTAISPWVFIAGLLVYPIGAGFLDHVTRPEELSVTPR
jgi:hypothetical protein